MMNKSLNIQFYLLLLKMLTSKKNLLEKCKDLGITVAKTSTKEKLIELIKSKEKTKEFNIESDKKVTKIYHLADIHIRYLERHLEYYLVFKKLVEYIQNDQDNKNAVMVISGDMFHNRDRFIGETIKLFDTFIKSITDIVPVFLIVGNHDCFNHQDRMDTISGIVNVAKYKNFYLLKDTGVYHYSNLHFGVSSLLDGGDVPDSPRHTGVNIALYHGIVTGTKLDNGCTGEGLSIDAFKGYDLVLLGDVHKKQFLNKQKTIAYPGSLIQQNYKEELEHGFLTWYLDTLTSQFIPIHNDYSFMDIPVNKAFDLSKIKFTKYSRLRLLIDHKDLETDITKTIEDCKKYTEVLSIKKLLKDPKLDIKELNEVSKEVNIQKTEENAISNFVKDEVMKKKILDLHSSLLTFEKEELFSKSLPWSITKIEFRNIFSYGEDYLNTIDLKSGVTGILADNASGKTNILNTIIYGIFGSSRVQNHLNKNIVSRYAKKEDLLVRLTVNMEGVNYYIERTAKTKTRSRIKSSEEGQLDITETLKFYTDENILNLSSKTETENLIKDTLSIIGKEEFILTNMMSNISYGQNMSIISMVGSKLDEVFNSIFNLGKYKELHQKSKNIAKEKLQEFQNYKTKIQVLKEQVQGVVKQPLQDSIVELESRLNHLLDSYSGIESDMSEVEGRLMMVKNVNVDEDEKSIKSQIESCDSILDSFTGDFRILINKEQEISAEYENLKKIYVKSDSLLPKPEIKIKMTQEEISTKIQILESSRKTIDFHADITNEYLRAKKFINSIKSESTLDIDKITLTLKNLKKDTNKNYILPFEIQEELLENLEKTYVDPNLLLKYKKVIEDKESRDDAVSFNIQIDQQVNTLKKDMKKRKTQDALEIRERLVELSSKLELIDTYLEKKDLLNSLSLLEDNKHVKELLETKSKLKKELEEMMKMIRKTEVELSTKKTELVKYNSIIDSIRNLEPKMEILTSELEVLKTYTDITHQRNLPKILISNVVKRIVDSANVLIYNTTGLLCDIQENEKWEIVIKKDDIILGPEHCSGYERLMLNVALKIAFDKYKQLSSIKLFMIDETIDCVSESNLDQIDVLLDSLKTHYNNVIMISHNEDLKKKIDNRINIKLDRKCSSIV